MLLVLSSFTSLHLLLFSAVSFLQIFPLVSTAKFLHAASSFPVAELHFFFSSQASPFFKHKKTLSDTLSSLHKVSVAPEVISLQSLTSSWHVDCSPSPPATKTHFLLGVEVGKF